MRRLQSKRTLTGCHPPLPSTPPLSPFKAVFTDFFNYRGCHYLVVGDRLSGWVEVLSSTAGTNLASSAGLVCHLRSFFATFTFLRLWGVRHSVSFVSFPQSNGRAEVAVKTAKRLLLSPTGSLDHDHFIRAMLQLRNSLDPDCNLSPT